MDENDDPSTLYEQAVARELMADDAHHIGDADRAAGTTHFAFERKSQILVTLASLAAVATLAALLYAPALALLHLLRD